MAVEIDKSVPQKRIKIVCLECGRTLLYTKSDEKKDAEYDPGYGGGGFSHYNYTIECPGCKARIITRTGY
ncbi:MAG: hypothetical protein A2381_19375 [Bdellovibrionales bacterium RIFOXYB1_FULL_37_110]|nr:MAG: hypothetical protein A2381_19375 [Bdellovibrionales bacterium RIFOXYB1_FULL_37_110]